MKKSRLELPPRLEYLMRIGLVDRSQLQQYKLAFRDPDNNVKFKNYRDRILEVFFKVFDIVADNDPIYEKVRQQVILRYKYNLHKKKRKPMKESKEYDDWHAEYNKPKGQRDKGWAARVTKLRAAVDKAKERANQAPDVTASRIGQRTDPEKHGAAISRLVNKAAQRKSIYDQHRAKSEERWKEHMKPEEPKEYKAPQPALNKPAADKSKLESKRKLADRVFSLLKR